jgi:hypothetical protein
MACAAGKFKDSVGSGECSLCPGGTYSAETGQASNATCTLCPTRGYSSPGSNTIMHCMCNLGYTGPNGTDCSACVPGKFKNTSGTMACMLCSRGKYSTGVAEIADSTCGNCTANSISGLGSSVSTHCICNVGYSGPHGGVCDACSAGTYKDVNGSAACLLCGRGKYSLEAARTSEASCITCNNNSFSKLGSDNVTRCLCNMGYTGPGGGPCEACAPGKFKPGNGSAACSLCSQGKYSDARAQISEDTCSSCPEHTFSVGGTNISGCKCNLGYTGPHGGACTACMEGKFKEVNGSSLCQSCRSFSVSHAASKRAIDCVCNVGYSGVALENCTACASGKYKAVNGSASCSLCMPGKYSTETGQIEVATCQHCPNGTTSYAGSGNITNCSCTYGYTAARATFGTQCMACAAGKFKDSIGSGECSLCPGGTYSAETGQASNATCTLCPTGGYSSPGVITIMDCMCNLGYTGPNGTNCSACVPGKFKNTSGTMACTLCSRGKYSTGVAEIAENTCGNCTANSISGLGSSLSTHCVCNVGYSGPHGGVCNACSAGTFKDFNGSAACLLCGRGKYSLEAARTSESSCIMCPDDNSFSMLGSDNVTRCLCNMGYTGPDGGPCEACAEGKFKPSNETEPCTQCAKGKHVSTRGSTSVEVCVACRSSTYSSADNSACVECPLNSFSLPGSSEAAHCLCNVGYTIDGSNCDACVAGTYKAVNGSAACRLCSQGKYSEERAQVSEGTCSACPAHTFSIDGSGSLSLCTCNQGYTGPDGGNCSACSSGKFKNVSGSAICAMCSKGKFSTALAASSDSVCSLCPAGKYLPFEGADDVGTCIACPPGKYSTVEGSVSQDSCNKCDQGKYKFGLTGCADCAPGKYRFDLDIMSCQDCPPASNSTSGSVQCSCVAGFAGPGGFAPCLPCLQGSITNVSGASTCTLCRPGKSSGAENTSCIDCVPGTYSNPPVTPLCARCAPNTFSNVSKETACSSCLVHKFTRRSEEWVNVTGGIKLIWNDTTGATICNDCPSIIVIPTYMKYADVDKPPVSLCRSSNFRKFCSPSGRNTTDVYANGKSVVHEQEVPMGCPIDVTALTNTTNRTSILCGLCGDADAAAAVAGAVSAAVGAAVGAAAAAGGANPALIDQIQFMALVGTGACAVLLACLCALCADNPNTECILRMSPVGGSQADPQAQAFSTFNEKYWFH